MDIEGKVAIVTGAGRGLGRATALEFARQGAAVVLVARSIEEITRVSEEIRAKGGRALAIQADVSKLGSAKKIVERAAKEWGRIDILVNNAGVAVLADVEDTSDDLWKRTIDTNLTGAFMMCRETLPQMKTNGGIIINVSSKAGRHGVAALAAYCASKFGVIGLTESMAAENEAVKAYAVCPGSIDTRMFHDIFPDEEARLVPEHVAKKIVQLCNGTEIPSGSSIEI